jgi:hypothetical protein
VATMTDEQVEVDVDLSATVKCDIPQDGCGNEAVVLCVNHCPTRHSTPSCAKCRVGLTALIQQWHDEWLLYRDTPTGVRCNLCNVWIPAPYVDWVDL